MAYGLILLRCTPMALSAASVNFSYNQYLFLQPYIELAKSGSSVKSTGEAAGEASEQISRTQVNAILAPYIHRQFPSGFAAILALYPTTWVAAGLNLATSSAKATTSTAYAALPRASRYLYAAGLIFSIGHMLWGPKAKDLMERLGRLGPYSKSASDASKHGSDSEDNVALLIQWMQLHVTRSLLADVPGWLCFTAAFIFSHRAL